MCTVTYFVFVKQKYFLVFWKILENFWRIYQPRALARVCLGISGVRVDTCVRLQIYAYVTACRPGWGWGE